MPFFTKEDMDQGNWCHRTEELMAMVNLYHSKNEELKEENEELKRVADHAEKVLEDSPVEEDDEGFAISDWFHEKMAKHIKFHMTDPGGEYNYIDPETKKHIFCLGSKGTLDDCRDFVENLEKEIEELKIKLDEGTEQRLADTKKLNEYYTKVKEENEELKKKIIGEHGRAERCKDKVLELLDIRMCHEDDVRKLKAENNEMRSKGRVLFYEDNLRLLQEIINKQKGETECLEKQIKTLEDIHNGDMKIITMLKEKWNEEQEKNKELKKDKEELFDAWLHYWSAAQLGCEHSIPMSEQEGGKYQILLDELDF